MTKRHNATGRSLTKGTFALIPETVMRSPAYTATSLAGRALLLEIAVLFRGSNNGCLGLSARQAAERLGCSKDTAARAFRELEAHGLIEATRRGKFTTKTAPLASEWRLTWRLCNLSNHLPSNAFLRWKPNAETPSEMKTTGPTGGTARSDIRDSKAPARASRSGHADGLAGLGLPNGPTTGTLLDSPMGG
jgi:hypothetical protein